MNTLFTRLWAGRSAKRFTWTPATEITAGWMVCALNPYGTTS